MTSTLVLDLQQLEKDMETVQDPGLVVRLGEIKEKALGADHGTESYRSVTIAMLLLRDDVKKTLLARGATAGTEAL